MAGNRVGKSLSGAFETTCHLTGLYPEWWTGRRFKNATYGWACGSGGQVTRDIVQGFLLGMGNKKAMIPQELIKTKVASRGITGAYEVITVQHKSGHLSRLGFKTYEQGRRAFEGEAIDFCWMDEEPPIDIYTEALYRLLTTKGIIYTTFTPLLGMSEVVTSFLEPTEESERSKYVVQAGWKDVPHLDENQKRELMANTPLYQIQARTDGTPTLGSGAIYPIGLEDILCDTSIPPAIWPRAFGMDVGWNRTAVVWAAQDPSNGNVVLYDTHYQGQGEPASHAYGIRTRGEWIPGVIDPAARGRSQVDGRQLLESYIQLGLDLQPALNTVESGLQEVWQALVSGKLKIQRHLGDWTKEFQKYHRDEKGHVVKKYDHLMDATRYLWMSGRDRMILKPKKNTDNPLRPAVGKDSWMA